MRQDTAKKEGYSLQGRGSNWEEEELLKQLGNQEEGGGGALLLKDGAARWTMKSQSMGSRRICTLQRW